MDEQVRWMARLLEASLQSSGLSEREVEERLGWEPGAFGRLLDGATEWDPHQLLALLAEIGSEGPGSYPSHSRHRERGTQMVQELIERFRKLGYGQPGVASVVPVPPATDEIERTVEDVLQRTFGTSLGNGNGKRGG
jgi:hypothetical protein